MKYTYKLLNTLALSTLTFSLPALSHEVILDDFILDGSLCVGTNCSSSEVFDFDTMKIKADSPQIRFEDTSSSATFPSNDWLMSVTSSATNISIFSIIDATANSPVLQMEAGTSGGVAIGANSDLIDNTISVGSVGNERRIINVATATAATDAVNKAQFDAFKATATTAANAQITNFDNQLSTLQTEVTTLTNRLNALVTRVDNL